ncbi:hypothetical protein MXF92_000181 [Acinetobacter baumannii]|nr:hypothetical protein [Acinetobacter baumannii]EKU2690946.1 hypothetical protein [Acinetobacter baumannii]EKU5255749.1 hypothetical protein [Acinetobacter baumannii]EKU6962134.1 hypothetical protein [Acinetobacter baumannii]EKU7214360.1 hypothetical protein [Acinetobacter baumannii]
MFQLFIGTPKAVSWLFSTVFLALFPCLIRVVIWAFGDFKGFFVYSITDIYLFSLVIHLSILHELRHLDDPTLKNWKEKFIALTDVFILLTMVFLICAYLKEAGVSFKEYALLWMGVFLAIVSFVIGFSVFYKLYCQVNSVGANNNEVV